MTTAEQLQRIEARLTGRAAERLPPVPADPGLEPIAIVGVAGFLPGCRSVREFWRALDEDRCLLGEIPADRFDWRPVYDATGEDPKRSQSKWGGFIPDVRGFDPDFFKIARSAAHTMDPRQRLLLMAAYHALEDAGWAPEALRGSRIGVFVAAEDNEYLELLRARQADWGDGVEEAPGMIANRIAHQFDFRGPSEYINTLCSGGAVALHRAVQSLRSGEITAAMVGAANVILRPEPFIQMSRMNQLSSACAVHSFGKGARGHLRAEGVVTVVLKPRARAEEDGDVIYALIRHTAVNHAGRSGLSLTTPDPSVHAELIRTCVEASGLDPRRLRYIEAQGMGNPLSDLAEWRAFNQALQTLAAERNVRLPAGRCLIGTLKPLAGHMEATSALAALLKVVHSLQTQTIHGIHGFGERHPELDPDGQPCALATTSRPWPQQDGARVAGLHAHGIGGNNAHVLVEEYVPRRLHARGGIGLRSHLIVLSAPSDQVLAQIAGTLASWLEQHADADLDDLAYTLQVGRDAFACRLALVVQRVDELARALTDFATSGGSVNGKVFHGRAARTKERRPDWNELAALAEFWAGGGLVSWTEAHGGRRGQRLALPPYPFALEECWLDRAQAEPVPASGHLPPEQDVRRRLIALIAEELRRDPVGIATDRHFLEQGIDSLAGLRLAQRLGRALGVPARLRDWLEHPTVDAYARFVASRLEHGEMSERASPSPAGVNDPFPLSECQRGLWAVQQMRPDTVAYNVPIAIRVGQRLERERLREAATWLLQRHSVLAARIRQEAGVLAHERATTAVLVEEAEFGGCAQAQIDAALEERLRRPFDLEQGPLVRFHLLHAGGTQSIVLLVLHHIVVDGLSATPIVDALFAAYADLARGVVPALPAPAVRFADFVAWEKIQLAGANGGRLKAYWAAQLAGEWPALELFAERPVAPVESPAGEVVTLALDRGRSQALVAWARTQRLSPATVFLAVFQTLLHRYSGQDDVIVGVPTQVRPDDRFANEVGYFLNLLPIRGRNLATRSFAELAQSLQRTVADGIDHAAYPFPRMVRDLGAAATADVSRVVSCGFEFQNLLATDLAAERTRRGPAWERLEKPRQAGEFDLVLEVVELADRFELHFKFAVARYPAGAIRRLADHFGLLAGSVATEPHLPPAARAMLTVAESRRLLHEWNVTQREFPREVCLHELIARQALSTPAAIAVRCDQRTLTYGELNAQSDTLARYLRAIGVGPEVPVAICLDRSPEMIVGLLAILKAGGAYVPMDATYPVERLAFMAKDSRAAVILTESRMRAGMTSWLAQSQNGILRVVVEIDGDAAKIEASAAATAAPAPAVSPEQLAYIIYTSGSTGQPKGVMISHRALVNLLVSMAHEPGLRREDRLLAVTTLSFDIAGLELFLPLLQGAECCLATTADLADVEALKRTLDRIRPTVMQATPSTWRMLLQAGWRNAGRLKILCGGEALPLDLAKMFVAAGMEAWNMYGPTETTIWSTTQRIVAGAETGIGKPIANTRVFVVDAQGSPVPVGVAGELLIGGEGLARGYWQKPELTAERFVTLPFLPGERLYRTGDLACWREDGTLHCLGRNDLQVKVRGHRIELGDIETQLSRHPQVRDCAAVVRDHDGVRQIVAYYVPTDANTTEPRVGTEALLAYLRRHLPAYMVPALVVELDALPLTLNGKKDRKSLAARRIERGAGPRPARPKSPATPETGTNVNALEAIVLAVWRELLRVENLQPTDGFFDAGGDSVTAVMVAARVSQRLGVPFTVTDLFQHATPRAISAHLALRAPPQPSRGGRAPESSVVAMQTGDGAACPDYYHDSLAIIGLSCRFPGADDYREFWETLRSGKDCGVRMSQDELRRAGVPEPLCAHPDFVPLQMAMAGKDEFDPDFFNIPAKNAVVMDPQFRHLLMHAWKAIEDAGYVPKDLADAGVFMAVSNTLYASAVLDVHSDLFDGNNYVAWLMAQEGSVATMISYQLGLRGPSYAVHANCASSVVALHAAWQGLRAGDLRCALVGAASVPPVTSAGYLNRKGLNFASDGCCRAFDAAADGTIAGEGLAVLVVKKASDAVADGDHIYALVRGVGVTNDGSDKVGFYAPGVGGHSAAAEKALRLAGVHPDSVSYIEAHGTGTKLGDPVEVAALTQAYGTETRAAVRCGLGSVKSNIGHLDTAAGLAGCVKVALSLQHRELPPTVHFRSPNPELKIEQSPFRVVDRLQPWLSESGPRRAGLSSLGIGGTNAHAILEEAPHRPAEVRSPGGAWLFVLSAQDAVRLRERAEQLLRFLPGDSGGVEPVDLAFTLQVGRVPMAVRVALVATSTGELRDKLAAWVRGEAAGPEVWEGKVERGAEDLKFLHDDDGAAALVERWLAERKLAHLAQFWVRGGVVDWRGLDRASRPRRVSLPTYPFARERMQLPDPIRRSEAERVAAPPKTLHPLLHENRSKLDAPRFCTTLTGREFFLADHVIQGERLLPAVAYLEMARAAVAEATGLAEAGRCLQHVAWVRPFTVKAEAREVAVTLRRIDATSLRFEISTPAGGADASAILLCQGTARLGAPATTASAGGAEALRLPAEAVRYDGAMCYEAFRRLGVDYGPAHRGIAELFVDGDAVLARLVAPAVTADAWHHYTLHPGLVDAAVHASIGFQMGRGNAAAMEAAALLRPFALEELTVLQPPAREMWARLTRRPSSGAARAETLDIDLLDGRGGLCVRLRGFFSHAAGVIPAAPATVADLWLEHPVWTAAPSVSAKAGRDFAERKVLWCGVPAPTRQDAAGQDTPVEWLEVNPPAGTADVCFTHVAGAVFRAIKTILERKPRRDVLLQVVIPAAEPAAEWAAVSGLLRTACLEQPRLCAQVIVVDAQLDRGVLREALALDARAHDSAEIRHRDGAREVRSLAAITNEMPRSLPWRKDGVYLITGGGGALARIFAEEIIRREPGARVVLAGRSLLPADLAARVNGANSRVVYRQADVTQRSAVEQLVAGVRREFGVLHGVVHAAGVIQDAFILRKGPEEFAAVLAPKVAGAVHLDAVLGAAELDFFILFSSLAGVYGSAGQADYATANAFLDEFAERRQALVAGGARRGRTLSIAWPLWAEGGMRADEAIERTQRERTGFRPMTTAGGIDAFYRAFGSEHAQVAVMSGDRARIRQYLAGLQDRAPEAAVVAAPAGSVVPGALAAAAQEFLAAALAKTLERPVHRIKVDEKFERYGLDSILAVELTNELESAFGSLPKTLFFEYPSLAELRDYFVQNHREKILVLTGGNRAGAVGELPQSSAPLPLPPRPLQVAMPPQVTGTAKPVVAATDIAIIGLTGRFPGAADLGEFWENLKAGSDGVTEVPAERWDWRDFDPAARGRPELQAGKWGGFIEGVDRFDPQLFNMAPREADLVDPQERLFLEAVWNLLEGVGCTRQNMRARYQGRVGVYAASMYQHYHAFRSDVLSEAVVSLSSFSGIANRVSYFFDFQGPSVAVDTMCSSAIVAIQMACDALRSGEVLCAIAGGVNLSLHYKKFIGLTASKLMGTRAESRSFAEGDGYLPAEGVGAVLLKPLARAIEDRDTILGVIKAATTNHSGQSGGFAVPNPKAQADALLHCLTRAGVDLRTVTYVESAANGSPLGDSIEVKALRAAFAADPAGVAYRRVGSVKSNIGHAEAASGMAQLAKVVLQLQHRTLVPTIKARPLNPNIELAGAPFELQETLAPWVRPVFDTDGVRGEFPLRAVIQSVGAGGSSAHLVVEEHRTSELEVPTAEDSGKPRLILLTARTRERLALVSANLQQHVRRDTTQRLCDIAHTLMLGREAMDHRAALVVGSRVELEEKLGLLLAQLREPGDERAAAGIFVGDVESANSVLRELLAGAAGEAMLQQWVADRALEKLGAWWTQGGEVPWTQLADAREGRMVGLPTYPFERRRCWIRETGEASAAPATAPIAPASGPASAVSPTVAAGLRGLLQAHIGELLGLAPGEVPATKPLHSLGFSSLDAVNLKSKLEQTLAVEVPLAALNAYQTVAKMEEELRTRVAAGPVAGASSDGATTAPVREIIPLVVPNPADRHEPFPLTDIQESFFAGRKLGHEADRVGCHIYFEIELPDLDIFRLNAAWNRLVERHDMLRTFFLPDGTQRVSAEVPGYRIKAADLRRMSDPERAEQLVRRRAAMSHHVYAPEQWPLFEVTVSLLPDRRVIHFSIDELIVDAASIDVLFQQWHALYTQPDATLPPLELRFRDYVLAIRRFTSSARYAKDLEYWVGKLRQLPAGPRLPGPGEAGLRADNASRACARLEARLGATEWSALKLRAEGLQVSPTALLLGLFSEALRTRSPEKTFSLILTFFNRLPLHPQVEQIVGPLISTSIFLADEVTGEELPARLRRTQRGLWADLDHNSVSGIAVLRELGRRRLRAPVVALPVVFTSMLGNRAVGRETLLRHLTYSVTQTPQVYLDHQLYEEAGELRFSWDVVQDAFGPGVVEALFEGYVTLLRRLAADEAAWQEGNWQRLISPPHGAGMASSANEATEPFPLTDQQQAYAFGRSSHGGGKGANVYLEIEAAHLDGARLEAAWQRLIAAHPMLRTVVRPDGRQQTMHDVPRYAVGVADFSALDPAAAHAALAEVARAMSARICPLGEWPYFELRVSRLPEGAARLHLCIDMLIADGASIDRLTQELLDLYADPEADWRPPSVTFRAHLQQLRAWQQTEAQAVARRYWSEKFADIPGGPQLPRSPDGAIGSTRRLTARISGWSTLRRWALAQQVAPEMVLLAAFVDVLWLRVEQKGFTIVVPAWDRPAWHPEIDRVVGDFTAMSWLVVRERVGTFGERVARHHRAVRADLEHRAASGLRELRKAGPRQAGEGRVNFPVVFTSLSPQPPLRLPAGMRLGSALSQTPQVELDNMTAEWGDELELCWDIASGLYPDRMMEAMFADYGRILDQLTRDPGAWDRADVLVRPDARQGGAA